MSQNRISKFDWMLVVIAMTLGAFAMGYAIHGILTSSSFKGLIPDFGVYLAVAVNAAFGAMMVWRFLFPRTGDNEQ